MEEEKIDEQSWKRPLRVMLALGLVLIMIFMGVPFYYVKLNPEPQYIPTIAEVLPPNIKIRNESFKLGSYNELKQFVDPFDPNVKFVANKIATLACDGNRVCQAKAMYYFVRDNAEYVADPQMAEYIEPNMELLASGGGDCESGSLVLASLEEAIGVDAQLVFIQGHAYVRIKLDEAFNKYKKDDWIYLDWTCKECGFGEIPWQNWEKEQSFLEVP